MPDTTGIPVIKISSFGIPLEIAFDLTTSDATKKGPGRELKPHGMDISEISDNRVERRFYFQFSERRSGWGIKPG